MVQALKLDFPPPLVSLLERELSQESIAHTLGLEAEVPKRLWDRALTSPLCSIAARCGKELRGRLVEISWELAGARGQVPVELDGIVEALHLGSLIVDDIEDGSTRRRGGPSLHHMVDLPLALNAGNWLYFLPTVLVSRLGVSEALELRLRRAIDDAVLRCHYGQALDLSVRVTELRQSEVAGVVSTTTRLKTGSLMELSARLGAITAGGEESCVRELGQLGSNLGVALQMLDDLTGITVVGRCHKGHEDLIQARATWPWAWLAERADPVAYSRLRALGDAVAARDVHPEVLSQELRERIGETGRAAIKEHLEVSLRQVQSSLGEARGFASLKQWISTLERYDG